MYPVFKRILDFVISLAALAVLWPLLLLLGLLVRLTSPGPTLFAQVRSGRGLKPFRIYKFRTMNPNAEAEGPQLFAGDNCDARLTPIGRTLRKHHLDELPQLWNVFVGDMAFVGPRPERKFYIDQIMEHNPHYADLYQVRPGVTSYATLYNGYTDTMEKMLRRLELDLYYLEHRSIWLNMKILWITFYRIISGSVF